MKEMAGGLARAGQARPGCVAGERQRCGVSGLAAAERGWHRGPSPAEGVCPRDIVLWEKEWGGEHSESSCDRCMITARL